jgi:PadR family transcriptional regulator PadR
MKATVDIQQELFHTTPVDIQKELSMDPSKSDVLQGTLDLMILKTLDTLGEMHGWGIAQRIKQVSQDLLQVNQGTLYPALLRVEQKGWIRSEWKITENNRRAKYYSLSPDGKKQLIAETAEWERFAGFMTRLLDATE